MRILVFISLVIFIAPAVVIPPAASASPWLWPEIEVIDQEGRNVTSLENRIETRADSGSNSGASVSEGQANVSVDIYSEVNGEMITDIHEERSGTNEAMIGIEVNTTVNSATASTTVRSLVSGTAKVSANEQMESPDQLKGAMTENEPISKPVAVKNIAPPPVTAAVVSEGNDDRMNDAVTAVAEEKNVTEQPEEDIFTESKTTADTLVTVWSKLAAFISDLLKWFFE